MGSPEFAVPTLDALINEKYDIIAVYTQPPRPAGRGQHPRPTPVENRARLAGLEVRTPRNFKDPSDVRAFLDLKADIAVVIAYGLILPVPILEGARLGAINLHASLLPRWRGAAPIQRAIMAGDQQSGVSLMKMEAGLDTGPVYTSRAVTIDDNTTAVNLHDRLAGLSAELLINHIDQIAEIIPSPQDHESAIYAEKISKAEAKINWNEPASRVLRHIHGLSPFPGAWSELAGERIKFHHVALDGRSGQPGTILDDRMLIACGEGAIAPKMIQREGRRPTEINAALNGLGTIQGKQFT